MLGYQDTELPSDRQSFLTHLHPEDRPRVESEIERHLRERTPYDVEYRLRRRDGNYLWCRARGQAIWDADGRAVRFSGATSDISEQKAAAANIQRLLTEKQALLDNIMVGIVHIRQELVVSCNRRFDAMFGYGPGDMDGHTMEALYLSPTVYKEIGRAAYATLARGDTYSFELNLRRRDGSSFWSRLSAHALDPAAPHDGSIWIFTDESERKEAIDALLEERAFSDAVINSLPGIFYLMDQDGRMLRWNANFERELGYRRRELVRLAPLDFLAPEARDDTNRSMQLALAAGRPTSTETLLLTRDSRRVPYYLTASAVDVHGGRLIVGVGIDLTARKEAEEQVRRLNEELEQRVRERTAELTAANKELEAFSYSVSHDLSSPLRGIDGFSRIIEEDYAPLLDSEGKRHLQRIRAATQRMQLIIDNMLSLSRITRNDLIMSPVSLSQIARQILDDLQSAEPERQVETVIAPDIEVVGDANLLHLVLDNLLRNAWKFTARHPSARIELGVLHKDGERVYFVRDDGAGFDMRYAGKLFREFQRIHRPSEFEGTGIGLAIASRVVQRHGGRMWAEAAVEEGATFYFTLPGRPEPGART
jgi:PAS domain S-box-containing protein